MMSHQLDQVSSSTIILHRMASTKGKRSKSPSIFFLLSLLFVILVRAALVVSENIDILSKASTRRSSNQVGDDTMDSDDSLPVAIIVGAGPSGLAAALTLSQQKTQCPNLVWTPSHQAGPFER